MGTGLKFVISQIVKYHLLSFNYLVSTQLKKVLLMTHLPFSPIPNAAVQMTSSRNSGLSRWLIYWLLYRSHKQILICVCLIILMMLCWNNCWMWAETYNFLIRKKLFKAIFTKLPIFWHFSNHSNTKKENK